MWLSASTIPSTKSARVECPDVGQVVRRVCQRLEELVDLVQVCQVAGGEPELLGVGVGRVVELAVGVVGLSFEVGA
jgi:hypothetical protein